MNKKIISIVSGLIILVILFIFITIHKNNFSEEKVSISVSSSPKDSKIVLNNSINLKQGDNEVAPGKYSLNISRNGFMSQETEIEIKNDMNNNLVFCLSPDSDEGKKYKQNENEKKACEGATGKSYTEGAKEFKNSNRILDVLPYNTGKYIIRAITSGDSVYISIYVIVDSYAYDKKDEYKEEAMNYLRSLKESHDIDINDYYIKFEN